jgi:hypothetical protein
MKLFKKHTAQAISSSEAKLSTIIELVKDLPRADYNRLREGMELIYNGYQKIKNAKTNDEKELSDIDNMESLLEVTNERAK